MPYSRHRSADERLPFIIQFDVFAAVLAAT
jgi:hypothetical protein